MKLKYLKKLEFFLDVIVPIFLFLLINLIYDIIFVSPYLENRIVYLSDLKPAAVSNQIKFAKGEKVYEYVFKGRARKSIILSGKEHSVAILQYNAEDINRDLGITSKRFYFDRFVAQVGIFQPPNSVKKSLLEQIDAKYFVKLDGEIVLDSVKEMTGLQRPVAIDIPVKGIKKLELCVDPLTSTWGDEPIWVNPYMIKDNIPWWIFAIQIVLIIIWSICVAMRYFFDINIVFKKQGDSSEGKI